MFKFVSIFCLLLCAVLFNNCGEYNFNPEGVQSIPPEFIQPEQDPLSALGKTQYSKNCAGCHGSVELSSVLDASESDIQTAFASVSQMRGLDSLNLNLSAISKALSDSKNGGTLTEKFRCENPGRRGLSNHGSRRLTHYELEKTLEDIFGSASSDYIESAVGIYPKEGFIENIREFQGEIDTQVFSSLMNLGQSLSEKVSNDSNTWSAFVDSCARSSASSLDFSKTSCNKNLVNSLGRKFFRRPLSNQQETEFLKILETESQSFSNNKEKLEALLLAFMIAPEFTMHLSSYTDSVSSKGLSDPYTVASRISYYLTGSAPDAQLLEAARMNQLQTKDQRRVHANRLLHSQKGRDYIRYVFYHYLRLNHISEPGEEYGSYINVSSNNLADDLKEEAQNFAEHIIFNENGTFEELLNSRKSFPPSSNSAKIFGVSRSAGVNDPKVSKKEHIGLFMRPVLMLSPEPRTSPITRGLYITKKALCREIPAPDPESLIAAEEKEKDLDILNVTSREETRHVTSSKNCMSCHQHINPPGFLLEKFGSFGDLRVQESIFDSNYNLVRKLPIETAVEDFKLDNKTMTVRDGHDLNSKLVESVEARACFAQNIFRFTSFRRETDDDDCHLAKMEELIGSQESIKNVFIQNAISEDKLWEKIN